MQLGSIILAGGRSRRMGRPKEALPFGDGTLLGHAVDVLLSCTHPVVVVARESAQQLPPLAIEAEIVHDEALDQGPLVGILSGLRHLAGECEAVYVTGCDAPFLDRRAVDWVARHLGANQVVMPEVEGHLQPLAAVYRVATLPTIERMVADGIRSPRAVAERCVTRILTQAETQAFDPELAFLRNLNYPADYDAARESRKR